MAIANDIMNRVRKVQEEGCMGSIEGEVNHGGGCMPDPYKQPGRRHLTKAGTLLLKITGTEEEALDTLEDDFDAYEPMVDDLV